MLLPYFGKAQNNKDSCIVQNYCCHLTEFIIWMLVGASEEHKKQGSQYEKRFAVFAVLRTLLA